MKTRLIVAAFIALGLAFGYCAGFVTSTIETVSDLPLSARSDSSHDGLTGVFQGMGRLAAAEIAAGNCGNKKQNPLTREEYAIRAIQDRASAAGLNPPLDVARARLALRRAALAETNNDLQLKAKYEETAQQLLQKSGWKDPSGTHMRQIVTKLDTDGRTCSPRAENGEQQK
jgi:hypothetical protein